MDAHLDLKISENPCTSDTICSSDKSNVFELILEATAEIRKDHKRPDTESITKYVVRRSGLDKDVIEDAIHSLEISGEIYIKSIQNKESYFINKDHSLNPSSNNVSGIDNISSFFIKTAAPVIAKHIAYICNYSLYKGQFPYNWKIARVAPIYKEGSSDERSNYRPISVLPVLSRLFEKLVYNQVYKYLDRHKSLYKHQSGFRSIHSVVTCLLANTNEWYLNLDDKKCTGMVFIDLKKAFDTVDHDILAKKLYLYGV